MCLAIPAKIIRINKNKAEVKSMGVSKEIDISLVPSVSKGDFVIVHAGFAIQILDKEDVLAIHSYWKDYIK